VRIVELRPLSLKDVENLAEVNNPSLKAIASQVDQAQSSLRAQIAAWYPTLSVQTDGFPSYTGGSQRTTQPVASPIPGQTHHNAEVLHLHQPLVLWAVLSAPSGI